MGCLYKITNKRNGKAYIGITMKTAKKRLNEHCRDAEKYSNTLLRRAIRKYGAEAFTVRTLKKSDSWAQLCAWEVEAIKRYGTKAPGGYNMTGGSDGTFDLSPEARAKWSAAAKRRNSDPGYMAKIHTPEARAKIGAAVKRLWADEEFRAKMKTMNKRLLAAGHRPGECTAFMEFCREHGLNGKTVRKRLRQRGLYGLKDINHPIVREVLEEMIAQRRTDTVPMKKPRRGGTTGLTLH